MDLSSRDVGRLLGLGRDATERVLRAGLAGEPAVRGRTHLYDRATVEALAARPVVDEQTDLPKACAAGLLVARIDPRKDMASAPRLAAGRAAVLSMMLATHGRVPVVTTVAGFVLRGADLTDAGLVAPGEWFEAFRERRVRTGPGEPWLLWRCDWCPPIPRDRPRGEDPAT